MRRVATIGVYGYSGPVFLDALRGAGVRLLLDVRQRRGVRGREYAWANSRRLQAALGEAGIEYEHWPSLAPTTELRQLQYAEDARQGLGKRSRAELAPSYVERYTREMGRVAEAVELPSSMVPQSYGEIGEYLASMTGLFATPAARDGMHTILSFQSAVRRGGIVGHGTMLRIDWLPTKHRTWALGLHVPIAQPFAFFPFSGWKGSFFGDLHVHGSDGIDFFTRKKVVVTRW